MKIDNAIEYAKYSLIFEKTTRSKIRIRFDGIEQRFETCEHNFSATSQQRNEIIEIDRNDFGFSIKRIIHE